MKVKDLMALLKEEDPEADVYGIDWEDGVTYEVYVGHDDDDSNNNVYIELEEI